MIGVLKKVNFIIYFKRMLIQYKSALYLVEQVDIVFFSLYVRSNWYQIQHIETVYIYSVHVFITKSISAFNAPLSIQYIEFLYWLLLTDRFIMFKTLQLWAWDGFLSSILLISGQGSDKLACLALLEAPDNTCSRWSVCWFQYWFWFGSCHQHLSLLSGCSTLSCPLSRCVLQGKKYWSIGTLI